MPPTRTHAGVEWAGCWAHARGRLFAAAAGAPKAAERVLQLIGRLYALEREWDETQSASDARRCARNTLPAHCNGCAAWPPRCKRT